MIWQATVTWTAESPHGTNVEDVLDSLTDHLADRDASIGPEGDGWAAVLTVDAGTLRQASAIALSAVTAAAAAAGQTRVVHTGVEVITVSEAERRLLVPQIPEVVDTKGAAGILGLTRQRTQQLSHTDPHFPAPLLMVGDAPVWAKAAMVSYAADRDPKPGRRPRAS